MEGIKAKGKILFEMQLLKAADMSYKLEQASSSEIRSDPFHRNSDAKENGEIDRNFLRMRVNSTSSMPHRNSAEELRRKPSQIGQLLK